MTWKVAAVLESNPTRRRALALGVKKAGLKVSAAKDAEGLTREQVVVLGASAGARGAREVRRKLPEAFLFAAMGAGFKPAWADAVLPVPVSPADLKVRLKELQEGPKARTAASARAGDAILDGTTSFYTFGHFKEVLFIEVKRARRYGFPLALAIIGFDPVAGRMDQALQTRLMSGLALSIRRSLRDTDYPVQYSPDRILLLMPHTDLAGSLIVARRICERISRATLQGDDGLLHPTISVGVAAGEPGREYGFSDLVRQAQDGLTAAVARGGNRVEFHTAAGEAAPAGAVEPRELPRVPPVRPPPSSP